MGGLGWAITLKRRNWQKACALVLNAIIRVRLGGALLSALLLKASKLSALVYVQCVALQQPCREVKSHEKKLMIEIWDTFNCGGFARFSKILLSFFQNNKCNRRQKASRKFYIVSTIRIENMSLYLWQTSSQHNYPKDSWGTTFRHHSGYGWVPHFFFFWSRVADLVCRIIFNL